MKRFNPHKLRDRQKCYFQALWLLGNFFGRGLTSFGHYERAAYYQLLLKGPSDMSAIALGRPASEYMASLRALPEAEPEIELVALDDGALGSIDGEGLIDALLAGASVSRHLASVWPPGAVASISLAICADAR